MALKKTALHDWHNTRANMVTFAGFSMPVVYKSPSSISLEHNTVRNHAGLFDVSHMGRMIIKGKDGLTFLNFLVPRDLINLPLNKIAYAYLLNEKGGFRDDITVAKIGQFDYLITWNAGNLMKVWYWITDLLKIYTSNRTLDIQIENITFNTAMIAFQGPKAPKIIEEFFGVFPGSWKIANVVFKDIKLTIFGSGYTGEAGCELIIYDTSNENPNSAITIWESLLAIEGVIPCGLGARDSLRIEAGMPLYGNDINEDISPIESGLGFPPLLPDWNKKQFYIGRQALQRISENKSSLLKRVGFIAVKKGPAPRSGMKIFDSEKEIGYVSSGLFSPLLKIGIGMGYIPSDYKAEAKTELKVKDMKGKEISIKLSTFPLYDPEKFGSKRIN